jgi:hypothetical protein
MKHRFVLFGCIPVSDGDLSALTVCCDNGSSASGRMLDIGQIELVRCSAVP